MALDPRAALEAEFAQLRASQDFDGAAALVVRFYGPEVTRYLVKVLGDADAADDAFSLLAEAVWTSTAAFRAESSVRTWVYALAHHALGRLHRDKHRRRRAALPTDALARLVVEVREATAAYRNTAVKEQVRDLRMQLGEEDRALIALRVDEGLEWRDIADVLGRDGSPMSEATLRKRFERAKARLKELAQAAGLGQRK